MPMGPICSPDNCPTAVPSRRRTEKWPRPKWPEPTTPWLLLDDVSRPAYPCERRQSVTLEIPAPHGFPPRFRSLHPGEQRTACLRTRPCDYGSAVRRRRSRQPERPDPPTRTCRAGGAGSPHRPHPKLMPDGPCLPMLGPGRQLFLMTCMTPHKRTD